MNDVDTELRITIDGNQHVGLSFFTCHSPNAPGEERGWRRQLKHDLATPGQTAHNCQDPPTCSYCQGAYFDSFDFCPDEAGTRTESATAACYCACGMTDYCLNNINSRSPSPPPPSPPPPSPPPP